MTGPAHGRWQYEQVMEQVRAASYRDKPGRLEAAFAFVDLRAAEFFRARNRKIDVLYEVELERPDLPQHIGDFNVVEPLRGRADTIEQIAHHYWAGTLKTNIAERPGLECLELVTLSPLRIVRQVD